MGRTARCLSPLIPYAAVAIGMYGLHSAWAALGLYHAGMLAAIIVWKRGDGDGKKRGIRLSWTPLAAIVFALGGIALYILWPYLSPDGHPISARLAHYGVTGRAWTYLAAYFCIANSAIEELFWRWYLGTDSRRIVLNDLLFAGYHVLVLAVLVNPLWVAPVFVACAFAGWLWRMLRAAAGGLLVPILTHLVADVSIVIAVHFRAFA